jgi:hypothetical protein
MSDSNLKKPGELVNLVNFSGYFGYVLCARAAKEGEVYITFSYTPKQVNEVHKFTDVLRFESGRFTPKSECFRGVRGVVWAVFGAKEGGRPSAPTGRGEYVELLLTDMSMRHSYAMGGNKGDGHGRVKV